MKKKRLLLTFIAVSAFISVFCGGCASNDDGRSEDSESVVSSEESVDNGDSIVLPEIEI